MSEIKIIIEAPATGMEFVFAMLIQTRLACCSYDSSSWSQQHLSRLKHLSSLQRTYIYTATTDSIRSLLENTCFSIF
jgi:hypothetical protein